MKKFWLLAVLPLFAQAQAPRGVDVTVFDVAGVRLGMSPEEAKAAVKAQFGVPDAAIEDEKFFGADVVTGEKVPAYFTMKDGHHELTVYHAANVFADKPQERAVYLVKYDLPYSQENVAAIAQAALEKYGENSNAPNDLPMHWCEHPHKNPGMGCDRLDEPKLEISQNHIQLEDPRYRDAINRWREQQLNTKPKL